MNYLEYLNWKCLLSQQTNKWQQQLWWMFKNTGSTSFLSKTWHREIVKDAYTTTVQLQLSLPPLLRCTEGHPMHIIRLCFVYMYVCLTGPSWYVFKCCIQVTGMELTYMHYCKYKGQHFITTLTFCISKSVVTWDYRYMLHVFTTVGAESGRSREEEG